MTGKHAKTKPRDRPRSDPDADPGIPILVALRFPRQERLAVHRSGWPGLIPGSSPGTAMTWWV
jgi:hypothetical protein